MPLSDFKPRTTKIEGGGASFEVRGLSLDDIGQLLTLHTDAIETIVRRFLLMQAESEAVGTWTDEMTIRLLTAALAEAPRLAATVIAYATDEPDAYEPAGRLPMPVQIAALRAVGELTFVDEAALKNALAGLQEMVTRMMPEMTVIPRPAAPINGNGAMSEDSITGFGPPPPY